MTESAKKNEIASGSSRGSNFPQPGSTIFYGPLVEMRGKEWV